MQQVMYFLLTATCLAQSDLDRAAREIIHNELKFSHTSVLKGRNKAFLEFLSDSCIAFNPLPTNAKDIYRNSPELNTYLTWKPVSVAISADGEFGYSTGPWEIRRENLGTDPVSVGYYFSVWKKEVEGWKVIFDTGIDYGKENEFSEKPEILLPENTDQQHVVRPDLQESEKRFTAAIVRESPRKAYDSFAASNIRLYRERIIPLLGKSAAMDRIASENKRSTFLPHTTKIACAKDLGFVCGIAVSADNDTSAYVRVWRFDKEWKIVVDIMNRVNR